MTWDGTRVVVTGAGGFIGSHLCDTLLGLGAEVTAFCRYNSRGSAGFAPAGARIVYGDLCDERTVEAAIKGSAVVFHLGAVISVPYSFEHPDETMRVNMGGALHVLGAARCCHCERVVMVSTSEVYGTAQYIPIDEAHPKNPQSPYAASKISSDALALSFHAVFNLPVTIVRPFNTYGPRQSDRAIIPTLIAQALWRDHIEVGNLSSRRDFTFVGDTVDGLIAAAETDTAIGQEINLGTGSEVSIGDLAVMVMESVGRKSACSMVTERMRNSRAEVKRLLSDNTKAQSLLHWAPQVDFIDGLARTVAFVKDNPGMYSPDRYRT